MARQQKPPAEDTKIIEGKALEKTSIPEDIAADDLAAMRKKADGKVNASAANHEINSSTNEAKNHMGQEKDKDLRFFAIEQRAPSPTMLVAIIALGVSLVGVVMAGMALWRQTENSGASAVAASVPAELAAKVASGDIRIAQIETRLSAIINDQDQSLAAFGTQLAALTNADDKNVDPERAKTADTAKKSNAPTGKSPVAPVSAVDLARLDQRFAALEEGIVALEKSAALQVNPTAAVSASSVMAPAKIGPLLASGLLVDNLVGRPLDRWIDVLQKLADQNIQIEHFDALKTAAAQKPISAQMLLRNAYDLVPLMASSLHQADADASLLERAGAKLRQMVKLRSSSADVVGSAGVLHRLELALFQQDFDGALQAVNSWEGSGLPALNDWRHVANQRQKLDHAVANLVAALLAKAIEAS